MTEAVGALECLLEDAASCEIIKQGAEAKVYRALISTLSPELVVSGGVRPVDGRRHVVLVKHRFLKRYRHPTLSKSITVSRTLSEARALLRCARNDVQVPYVELVDETRGILGMEWISGLSVRQWLGGVPESEEEDDARLDTPAPLPIEQQAIMDEIGRQIAKMHCVDVIHGDLTTSNMMLRRNGDEHEVVLIDFGLATVSSFWEDKAVDLYVLERAFASTHPTDSPLFTRILNSYAENTDKLTQGNKKKGSPQDSAWRNIEARLREVRLRGRKRSMVG